MLVLMNSATYSVSQSRGNDDANGVQRSKRLKSGEDRISALPDSVIHRILSFLPTTQDAIKTCILSKRWKYQWTHVPVLHFESAGLTPKSFSTLIENTLARYDCSTLEKFSISSELNAPGPPLFWIHFAIRRKVEELILSFPGDKFSNWWLPQFLFNNGSLIYLKACNWMFKCSGKVNWPSLKSLHMCYCVLPDGAIENVMAGSPFLESLEILSCEVSHEHKINQLVIASTSLKTLLLEDISNRYCSKLEISCPNLEKLYLLGELLFRSFKLLNLPSSISIMLDFVACELGGERGFAERSAVEIIKQMHRVEELFMGPWLTKVLSDLEVVRGLSFPLLHIKDLTFAVYWFQYSLSGITYLLRNSPMLEKLVIALRKEPVRAAAFATHDLYQKWNSGKDIFDCLPPHLKSVEIVGLYEKCYQYQQVLGFIGTILRRARILEKMVIFLDEGCRLEFAFELSKFLMNIPRRSPHVIVDIPRSPGGEGWLSKCNCKSRQ